MTNKIQNLTFRMHFSNLIFYLSLTKMIGLRIFLFSVLFVTISAHISDYVMIPGLKLASISDLNTRVLCIDSFSDFLWANLYVG